MVNALLLAQSKLKAQFDILIAQRNKDNAFNQSNASIAYDYM